MSVPSGIAGIRAAGSCRVQRAVVYQRLRPERSVAYSGAAESGYLAGVAAGGQAGCRRRLGGRPCAGIPRA